MLSDTHLADGPFVAVDIETTGARPGLHSIIEIGAVRVERGRTTGDFQVLVKPSDIPPPAIEALTGITPDLLRGAMPIGDALTSFRGFAEGAVLVAHNHRFDLGFLDFEAETLWGEPFPRPVLDTLSLANRLHPEEDRHNLRDLAERYGANTTPTHRALADATATSEIFLTMVPQLLARGLSTAGQVVAWCGMASQSALSRVLPLTTGLPDCPGVYMFRDSDGTVIHVGRAKNLRVKVRAYFYATGGGGRHADIGTGVADVRWIPCSSDLDALLLESRLVTRYRPAHNALVLRGDRGGWSLHFDTTSRFPAVRVVSRPPRKGVTVGPFTNRSAVETVAEHLRASFDLRRCSRRVNGDLSMRPCQHRDTGGCPRPCVEDVSSEEYVARVHDALAVFDGAIDDFRSDLVRRMEHSAASHLYEDAIRYRDGIRALDRSMAALRTVRRATSGPGSVIVEAAEEMLTVHIIRRGYLVKTLRTPLGDALSPATERRLERLLARAHAPGAWPDDPSRFTPRQLRDVFVIDTYRTQHAPVEIAVTGDVASDLPELLRAIRRFVRVPRKTHAARADA